MDDFFKRTTCQRCGGSLEEGRIMSRFDTSCICIKCSDDEKNHKDYKKACDAENEEIKKGNYNFGGIGYGGK